MLIKIVLVFWPRVFLVQTSGPQAQDKAHSQQHTSHPQGVAVPWLAFWGYNTTWPRSCVLRHPRTRPPLFFFLPWTAGPGAQRTEKLCSHFLLSPKTLQSERADKRECWGVGGWVRTSCRDTQINTSCIKHTRSGKGFLPLESLARGCSGSIAFSQKRFSALQKPQARGLRAFWGLKTENGAFSRKR